MRVARRKTGLNDGTVDRSFGRAAGRRLVTDDLGAQAEALVREFQQITDFAFDLVLFLARHHASIEQEIAGGRQHVVGVAAIDPRHREACRTDQRMAAMAHDLLVMLRDKA